MKAESTKSINSACTQWRYGVYCLSKDKVIAHPTDTIYGLSALPGSQKAANKLLQLKNRHTNKGLILLSADINHFIPFIAPLSAKQWLTITTTKTPSTFLVPKSSHCPYYICGEFETVAIRFTKAPIIKYLTQQTNSALLSSSANISGYSHSKSGVKFRQYFGYSSMSCIISPNRPKLENTPSTIINLETQAIHRD